MGLRDDIAADLADAFNADLADAVGAFTGVRTSGQSFDPVTETWVPTTLTYTGRGVFGGYGVEVADGINILRTDTKLTALQVEVTGTPQIDDKINGLQVIHVGKDPAGATWILQLRKV